MSYEAKMQVLIPQMEELGVRPVTINLWCNVVADIDRDYGPNSPNYLRYHNADHTVNMTGRGLQIMQLTDISPEDAEIVIVGSGYHDRYQGKLHGPSEEASADAAMAAMEDSGAYTTHAIWQTDEVIKGTVWFPWRGGIVQYARTPLAGIVSDSDTGSVGERFPVAWEDSRNFYLEQTPGGQVTFSAMSNFLITKTLPFFENHEFKTQAARECFPYRADNIAILRDCITIGILPEDLAA